MSIDTYFCFCCLSTDDLLTLYGFNSDENYSELLAELFSVEPYREDYEDDSYICSKCAQTIKEFQQFQRQLRATITILQANGLINAETKDNHIIVRKATSLNTEDKKILDENDLKSTNEDIKLDDTGQDSECYTKNTPIKIENGKEIIKEYLQSTESKLTQIEPRPKDKIKEEKPSDNLKCKECHRQLPNMYTYHKHMNEHFPNYICDTCGNGFLTQKKLNRHKSTHKLGPFICDVCLVEYNNYNTLISHRRLKHNPNVSQTSKEKKTGNYICNICERKYASYGSLYTHLRSTHNKHRRYFCYLCADGFYHKQDLYAHESTHTRANMYQCTHCDKSYLRNKALKVHMRTHTNERRFICDVCGKGFIQKCTLTAHVKTHNTKAQS